MEKEPEPFSNIAAVVVSFHPGSELLENVRVILKQVTKVIVVDNGSDSGLLFENLAEMPGVDVIYNQKNPGIATALNQGFDCAISSGFEYVLTLDQDSKPMPGMVKGLLDVFQVHPRAKRIALVGPSVEDQVAGVRSRYLRSRGLLSFELVSCEKGWVDDVTFVITSGMLCGADVYRKIGPFRNELFIDYVDIEYCLRAKKSGYEIVVNCDAHLIHRLGRRQKRVIAGRTEYPRFHPPVRWYYSSRNRIPVLKDYAAHFPHWFVYESLNFFYGFARMILLEDQRRDKISAFLRGIWDGLRGRFGPA